MYSGIKNVIWNIRLKGWDYAKKYVGICAAASAITCVCGIGVYKTHYRLNNIIAIGVLEREREGRPEYIYVNDSAYEERVRKHLEEEDTWSPGPFVGKWVGSFRRAVWRRLLNICHNGTTLERLRALYHLSSLKHLNEWDWTWLSQRLDAHSLIWLARHGGRCACRLTGNIPPLPSSTNHTSFVSILASLTSTSEKSSTCRCLENFLQEQIDHQQEVQRLIEQEASGSQVKNIDENAELLICLEKLLHHLDMSPSSLHRTNVSFEEIFVRKGGLYYINKAAYSNERSLQLAAGRLLLRLSHFPHLLPVFHRAGLISILAKWLEDGDKNDAELCCMAAGALASFEDGINESKKNKVLYDPAVQLLHPIHHMQKSPQIDVVFIHGLLGSPFVTWRQRDNIGKDLQFIENEDYTIENFIKKENFDVVLRDIPETSVSDTNNTQLAQCDEYQIFNKEKQDLTTHTKCWPRDWLPHDCPNIRVLGVSYDTMMMEWSSGCTGLGNTEHRAQILGSALKKAGVGLRPIVWIAHSMGGLLVKHMLVQSFEAETENERQMAINTKGIIFFSTPHHGTRAANNLIWPSKEVQDLRQDSKILGSLHRRWLLGCWPSICIGETRSTTLFPGISMHLVLPDSANDNSGPFYTLPLDHLDICKPATRYSFIYKIVVEMVQHAKGERCSKEGCNKCINYTKRMGAVDALMTNIKKRSILLWEKTFLVFNRDETKND